MSNHIILEVYEGPMDGLNCKIDKCGMIGRSVGNHLSLALDKDASGRHLEVLNEGNEWCIRDQHSTNGTWYKGKKIIPGKKYPISFKQPILVGSTVIVPYMATSTKELFIHFGDAFLDPRDKFNMGGEVKDIWEQLYANAPEGGYCDVSSLCLAAIKKIDTNHHLDKLIEPIGTSEKFKILSPWLVRANFDYYFSSQPNTLAVAPRVWHLLEIAKKNCPGRTKPQDLIFALLTEGNSLAARFIKSQKSLLAALTEPSALSSQTAPPAVANKKNIAPQPKNTQQTPTNKSGNSPKGISTSTIAKDKKFEKFTLRIEKIVLGLLEDSTNPISGQKSIHLPGFENNLKDILGGEKPGKPKQDDKYLETLYNVLIAILASQRECYKDFGEKIGKKLVKSFKNDKNKSSSILPLGKKGIDTIDLSNKIRSVLSMADSEGISDNIIREKINEKLARIRNQPK